MYKKASMKDLGIITSCVISAFSPYIPMIGKEPGPMKEDYEQALQCDEIWLCYDGELMEGFIYLIRAKDHLIFEVLAVNPECQGRGIGKQLVAFGEEKALEYGYHNIEVLTNEAFAVPQRLYSGCGYLEYKRGLEDGYQRIYYRKMLV